MSAGELSPGPERRASVIVEDLRIVYRIYEDHDHGLRTRLRSGEVLRRKRQIEAVRGISFTLHEGESVGIIGANGSGKSTLLSALTGLLPIESGQIRVRGRPTLLGVSAALRPTLSGRRNVVIGGLALGLSRSEIQARMEEIVEFAGLADHIDLPLQSYSSGMRARLAFSIATSTMPEVLLVDEALAVGDEEFRDRSQTRINAIRANAGTVVLVSHNLNEITASCDRAIWLDKGLIRVDGPANQVVEQYRESAHPSAPTETREPVTIPASVVAGPRRFILHAGVAETGTFPLQTRLAESRTELARLGLWFPEIAGSPNNVLLAAYSSSEAAHLAGVDPRDWASWRTEFERRFVAEAPRRGGAVASSQHLSSDLDPAGVDQLKRLLERAGYESVRVVIHLRRQDERASASYINRIQQAKLKPFDVAAHLEAARAYDYDELIRRWETHPLVEEVTVRLYPGQAGGASPTIMLLEELGLDVSDLHAGDLVDPTPEVDAVAAEFVRRLGLAAEVHGTDAQARSIRVALSVLAGRSDGLSIPASDAVKIMTAFAESNALALARVDGGDEAYFEPKAGPDPPPLDPQSVLELTGELWRYALDRIP